jgi:hypothetical protein
MGSKSVLELETNIAEPFSRHGVLKQGRINAGQMEGSRAAIAAQEFTVAATRRAIVIVIILAPSKLGDIPEIVNGWQAS